MSSVIPHIIDQHAEEAAFLWLLRCNAVDAPNYDLNDLAKLDDRVDAHLDGLRIAGDYGWQVCNENLQIKESGEVFTAAIMALEGHSLDRINQVYTIVEEVPETINGLISAFGWVGPQHLQGKVNGLLVSERPFWRQVGIAACAIHRVDPGKYLEQSIRDDDIQLKSRAIKAVGELGRVDLKPLLLEQLTYDNDKVRFWSAWSAALIGDRNSAVDLLHQEIESNTENCFKAMQLAFLILDTESIKQTLKVLAGNKDSLRQAIIGSGISGDPSYIPWLIQQMNDSKFARVAGEAFSAICGVDIAYQDLEGELPDVDLSGPNEDPDDDNIALDPDEDLPCPDPLLVNGWWLENQHNFKPGVRYLYGKPSDVTQCDWGLRQGNQRIRHKAALFLALTRPNQILFEVGGRGKRQQQTLAQTTQKK